MTKIVNILIIFMMFALYFTNNLYAQQNINTDPLNQIKSKSENQVIPSEVRTLLSKK